MGIAHALFLIVWLGLSVVSCAGSSPSVSRSDETQLPARSTPDMFKLLTFNALHGLATGTFGVAPGETPAQNASRLRLLIAQLAREHPDVVFLQEVNPLPHRAERYVGALKALGLDYTQVHQVDACGMRAGEKAALFTELNNGLAILAKRELQLQKLMGLKLSGDLGKCQSTAGFQLGELRYALIAEIRMPGSTETYLLASTHLHSGFETGSQFLSTLADLHREGRFKRYAAVKWDVEQARLRRIGELDVLIRTLNKLNKDRSYSGIVIAGDLNFELDFPEYEEVQLLRFSDTSAVAEREGELYTADPVRNGWIRQQAGQAIPQLLLDALAPEEARVQEQITASYREELQRPRRIDYILVDGWLPGYCLRQDLFGLETDHEGFPASDHYGLLNTYRPATGEHRCRPGQ
ncbi:MAG: endonuclease/exonuclease/phosphatase family protein [Nitrospiraceae bacterium]